VDAMEKIVLLLGVLFVSAFCFVSKTETTTIMPVSNGLA
jgi:hypothetical protein